MTSYLCDHWMPINTLIRLMGMGGLQVTIMEVISLGMNTKEHGHKHIIFQLMTPQPASKMNDIYIRADPTGSPHTINRQDIKIEGRPKFSSKG